MQEQEQFLYKLGEIPVLNDGWTTACDYYLRMKDYNSLTKFTLGVAESGVKKAADISTPVFKRYQPQIDNVNIYACNKLDEIENKYPLLRQPSGDVKNACLGYVEPVVGRVKPVVTYVNGVVDSGRNKVQQVKTCSTNLVVGAKDFGVGTVNRAVSMTLDTRPGRLATRTMDGVLTCADGLVDKYLPGEQEEDAEQSDDENDDDNGVPVNDNQVEEMEVMEPSPERVVVHIKSISSKLRKRMFQRAMRDFQGAKVRTMDAIGKLTNTVDLIDYAKKNIGTARGKVEDMWGKIVENTDQSQDENQSMRAGTLEDRIVVLGRMMARQVRNGISTLEKASSEAGQFVQHPITKTKEYKDLVYNFSSDLTSLSVEKARANIAFIQKNVQLLIDNVQSPEWLAMDIEMDGIGLEEGDVNDGQEEETETPRPENHI